MASGDRPLYLVLEAKTREELDSAVELIRQYLRDGRATAPPPPRRDEMLDGQAIFREKIPVQMDPLPGFDVRAAVAGTGDSFLQHIIRESGARVWLTGRGSVSV